MEHRIFAGVFPAGIVYADRAREEFGDYKRLAFLPFRSLELEVCRDCPAELREEIERAAATVQAQRGAEYQISTSGQSVALGG